MTPSPKLPPMGTAIRPAEDGYIAVARLGDVWVIGLFNGETGREVVFGDFVIHAPPRSIWYGTKEQLKPSAGQLIGKTFPTAQAASDALWVHAFCNTAPATREERGAK